MTKSIFLSFLVLFTNVLVAQKILVQQLKGNVQYSTNGKSGWKTCKLNSELVGYLKLNQGASIIFGAKGKSMYWNRTGIYKTSELEKQLIGFNNDAAAVLWEQVTHHNEPKKNSIGGVSRGDLFDNALPSDSSVINVADVVKFSFENPNQLKYKLHLKSNTESFAIDTTLKTRQDFFNFKFQSEGEYIWGITDTDTPSPQVWKLLFVVSSLRFEEELNRYRLFIESINDFEPALKDSLIETYLLKSRIVIL
jgi:hypothetical protein